MSPTTQTRKFQMEPPQFFAQNGLEEYFRYFSIDHGNFEVPRYICVSHHQRVSSQFCWLNMVKFHKQTCKSYYIIFTKPLYIYIYIYTYIYIYIYICSLGFRATLPCRAHLPTSARYGSTPRLRSSLRGQYQQRPALLKPTCLLEYSDIM